MRQSDIIIGEDYVIALYHPGAWAYRSAIRATIVRLAVPTATEPDVYSALGISPGSLLQRPGVLVEARTDDPAGRFRVGTRFAVQPQMVTRPWGDQDAAHFALHHRREADAAKLERRLIEAGLLDGFEVTTDGVRMTRCALDGWLSHLEQDARTLAAEIRQALEGDSNDAEHDALVNVAQHLGIEYAREEDTCTYTTE
ncbi:MAG: hypothetical protein JHD16_00400 [Solirubrobacteraceae bacterium]|nr:hypothetical protein [Solirubrobacteraceae bacterium]